VFTGLVESTSRVLRLEPRGTGVRLVLASPEPGWTPRAGESIAVSGACLSCLAGESAGELAFDLTDETLERTWFRRLEPGRELNLERALRLSDRLDGHLVSGHVDGVGHVRARTAGTDGGARLQVEAPASLQRFLFDKGSITVDGVSLTVVAPRAGSFEVALIPATLEKTTLGRARAGDAVNLEADLLGKWVERLLRPS
jgi:riboflavin synthase